MVRLRELIEALSDQRIQTRTKDALDRRICKICGGLATEFRSHFTKMEYKMSAICEKCQDYYYLNEDNEPSNKAMKY